MKKLLIILALMMSLQADKILLSGVSIHKESHNLDGTKVNSLNYGVGYQKYLDNSNTITALVLKDSFNNPMVSITYGVRTDITSRVSIGLEFGVDYKKILYKYKDSSKYEYTIIPIALVPTLSFKGKDYTIDILYLPEIDYNSIHMMSVTLIMIGVEI